MTINVDSDYEAQPGPQSARLPFSSSDAELAGIRVTRAQFARMMGCSKQAVTDWVKSGRIVPGADERFDPRQAVARLLATGDPARLRAKVLKPLVGDIAARDRRIAELEAQLAEAREDAEFNESSADGFATLFNTLEGQLVGAWGHLRAAPAEAGLAACLGWLNEALDHGADQAGEILDYLVAPGDPKEAEGSRINDNTPTEALPDPFEGMSSDEIDARLAPGEPLADAVARLQMGKGSSGV